MLHFETHSLLSLSPLQSYIFQCWWERDFHFFSFPKPEEKSSGLNRCLKADTHSVTRFSFEFWLERAKKKKLIEEGRRFTTRERVYMLVVRRETISKSSLESSRDRSEGGWIVVVEAWKNHLHMCVAVDNISHILMWLQRVWAVGGEVHHFPR